MQRDVLQALSVEDLVEGAIYHSHQATLLRAAARSGAGNDKARAVWHDRLSSMFAALAVAKQDGPRRGW